MSSKNLIKSPSGRKLDEMIGPHLTLIKYKGIGLRYARVWLRIKISFKNK